MKNILSCSGILISIFSGFSYAAAVKNDETVILFPASGYVNVDNQWVIPLHGWIFEYDSDSIWRAAGVSALRKSLQLNNVEMNNDLFKQRAWMFLVDNKRRKKIRIVVNGETFECQRSKPNGHFIGEAKMPKMDSNSPQQVVWMSYEVELKAGGDRRFKGESQLIPRQGLSVISDIDDTIKDSHVTDKSELLKNTFLMKH